MDVYESDIGIIEFGWVVFMDHLLELVVEALHHCLEGVVHLFCCFVVNEELLCCWVEASEGMSSRYLPGLRGR